MHSLRYPSGAAEFQARQEPLKVGDTLTRNGDQWIVETVTESDVGAREVTLSRCSTLESPAAPLTQTLPPT